MHEDFHRTPKIRRKQNEIIQTANFTENAQKNIIFCGSIAQETDNEYPTSRNNNMKVLL